MNCLNPAAFGLLVASCFIYASGTMADTSAPESTGTIVLRNKDNGICTLTVPPAGQTVNYRLDTPGPGQQGECWYDSARNITFYEMPSATKVLLTDWPACESDERDVFQIELKTTKKQTNTTIIEIEYLTTFKPLAIIEPGLQLITSYVKPGNTARDNVACVKITTSAAPSSLR